MRIVARMNMGGPAHHVALLSSELPRDRYRTLLVSGRVGEGEEELDAQVGRAAPALYREPWLAPEIRPLRDAVALVRLVRLMRTWRPDVVHTHTAKAGLLGRAAARLALGRRTVVVHTYHGHVLEGYFGRATTEIYRLLERVLACFSDCLVGVSQATVDDLVRLRIAPRHRFRVVPLGLDLAELLETERGPGLRPELGLGEHETLLVFVGRLVPIKRVDLLIDAVAAARHEGTLVTLAVVGGGDLERDLRRHARVTGAEEAVHFLGYRSDMATVLCGADAAVLASANEGTPVALIEAAAAGLPLIATDVGGVRDVVVDGAGIVVAPGDVAGLAGAMACIADNPSDARRMGASARRHVRDRYAAARLVGDVDFLYRELWRARGDG